VAIIGVAGTAVGARRKIARHGGNRAANIPEDRTRDGVVAEMTIAEKSHTGAAMASREAGNHARELMNITISGRDRHNSGRSLSGGISRKMILARERSESAS